MDICIFCLSLMGTNFPDFLREANRVLKPGGKLFVAEVLSRFVNVEKFTEKYMPQYSGFELLKLSKLEDFFYIMVYKKIEDARVKPNHLLDEFAS
jgi:ribosomal RNA-processing protein 8